MSGAGSPSLYEDENAIRRRKELAEKRYRERHEKINSEHLKKVHEVEEERKRLRKEQKEREEKELRKHKEEIDRRMKAMERDEQFRKEALAKAHAQASRSPRSQFAFGSSTPRSPSYLKPQTPQNNTSMNNGELSTSFTGSARRAPSQMTTSLYMTATSTAARRLRPPPSDKTKSNRALSARTTPDRMSQSMYSAPRASTADRSSRTPVAAPRATPSSSSSVRLNNRKSLPVTADRKTNVASKNQLKPTASGKPGHPRRSLNLPPVPQRVQAVSATPTTPTVTEATEVDSEDVTLIDPVPNDMNTTGATDVQDVSLNSVVVPQGDTVDVEMPVMAAMETRAESRSEDESAQDTARRVETVPTVDVRQEIAGDSSEMEESSAAVVPDGIILETATVVDNHLAEAVESNSSSVLQQVIEQQNVSSEVVDIVVDTSTNLVSDVVDGSTTIVETVTMPVDAVEVPVETSIEVTEVETSEEVVNSHTTENVQETENSETMDHTTSDETTTAVDQDRPSEVERRSAERSAFSPVDAVVAATAAEQERSETASPDNKFVMGQSLAEELSSATGAEFLITDALPPATPFVSTNEEKVHSLINIENDSSSNESGRSSRHSSGDEHPERLPGQDVSSQPPTPPVLRSAESMAKIEAEKKAAEERKARREAILAKARAGRTSPPTAPVVAPTNGTTAPAQINSDFVDDISHYFVDGSYSEDEKTQSDPGTTTTVAPATEVSDVLKRLASMGNLPALQKVLARKASDNRIDQVGRDAPEDPLPSQTN